MDMLHAESLARGEKTVVVRLGSHGFAFMPGLQSQSTLALAPEGTTRAIATTATAARSILRASMRRAS